MNIVKILFVSASPLKYELSIGNTFLNLFDNVEDVEMASICTRKGTPASKISKCFCITEKMIINNILRKTPAGEEIDIKEERSKKAYINEKTISIAKKYRLTAFFWLQDFIWKIGRWKSPALERFVKEYNPDIIFTVLSNSVYLNNLILHIKKLSGKKLVLYAWDNNYSLKQFVLSPFRWVKHFIDRASMRRVAGVADLFYVISAVQKRDYEKAFSKKCKILTKAADFSTKLSAKTNYNTPLQLVYTGNIELNRWKSLSHIANVLEKINENGTKAQLKIYSGNTLTKKMESALNKENSSFFMGSVPADKVCELQKNADFLVHVEALDLKNKLTVRQSFSTKIVDYLAAAKPILAFGPKDVASIEHLVRNDCAIVADCEEELYNKLCTAIDDKSKLEKLALKAFECGKKCHNKSEIDSMLKEDFERLLK